jgi:DNA-binding ferritin-like protein
MSEKTRPLSIRLTESDIDQLAARARRISGTPTGVARELIRSGLTDGDPFTQAERLLKIERRLAALSQDLQSVANSTRQNGGSLGRVESMFDELLHALSGQPTSQEA